MNKGAGSNAPTPPLFARIPPPVWAIAYLVLAIVASEAWSLPPIAALHQVALGMLLILVALSLIVSAQMKFRAAGTEILPASPTNKALVTTGPYRFTRNPMYLGLVLLTLGIAFLVATLPFFLVPVLIFVTSDASVIPFEEAKMERQFGDEYRAYKARVRRWI